MANIDTTLGDLINVFYEEFMDLYQDEDIASVATAAVVNDLLSSDAAEASEEDEEAA